MYVCLFVYICLDVVVDSWLMSIVSCSGQMDLHAPTLMISIALKGCVIENT